MPTAKALRPLALVATLLVLLGTTAAHTSRALKATRNSAVYTVTATAYEAVASQTDSKPFITADNSRIPRSYGSHTRWLALSRDLLRPWGGPFEFGDKVRVRGVSQRFDGVYTVHDTMNRRYRHRLDLLVHPRERISINQPGVKLQRLTRKPSSTAAHQAPLQRAYASKSSKKHRAPRKTALRVKKKQSTKKARSRR
ncbi:MAG: hypothetical protein ACRYG7_20895 [Janthinobacterium lividum]